MRGFLTLLAWFAGIAGIWAAVMATWNLREMRHERPMLRHATLALGDSHIGCAVDTAVLIGARNAALPAEPYMLSWFKLRKLLETNPIDTVIIGFAPHNISEKDPRRFKDHGWSTERLMMRTYPLLSASEAIRLPLHKKTYLRTVFMQLCTAPNETHIHYMGEFSGLRARFRNDSQEALERHFLEADGAVAPISGQAIAYLDSIVNRCEQDGIALYLARVPVHESYLAGIPPEYLMRFDSLGRRYAEQGIAIIGSLDLFRGDSLFANSDHLNAKGAKRFTRLLLDGMGRSQSAPPAAR